MYMLLHACLHVGICVQRDPCPDLSFDQSVELRYYLTRSFTKLNVQIKLGWFATIFASEYEYTCIHTAALGESGDLLAL